MLVSFVAMRINLVPAITIVFLSKLLRLRTESCINAIDADINNHKMLSVLILLFHISRSFNH